MAGSKREEFSLCGMLRDGSLVRIGLYHLKCTKRFMSRLHNCVDQMNSSRSMYNFRVNRAIKK